jgi:hypothetical protein
LAAAEVVAAVAAAPDGRPQPAVGAEAEAEAVPAGAVVAALASLSAAPDAAAVAVAVPGVRAQRVQPAERASALPRVSAAVVEAERPGVFAPVPAFSG